MIKKFILPKLVLLILATLLIIFVINYGRGPTEIFIEDTWIGGINLSKKSKKEGLELLDKLVNKPFYLNLDNSSRSITLNEIGINYNSEEITKYVNKCSITFPFPICNLKTIPKAETKALMQIDEPKLSEYLSSLDSDFSTYTKNNIVSFEDYTFAGVTDKTTVSVDRSDFIYGTILDQVSRNDIKITLKTKTQDDLNEQKIKTQELMSIVAKPLLIKYGRNPIYIQTATLNKFMELKKVEGELYKAQLYDLPIYEYLKELVVKYPNENVILIENEAVEKIKQALLYRAANNDVNNAVVLPLQGKSKTDGSLHDVYLEVIKSQQRLYRFENGELAKTYVVSTGLTWETPTGQFKVLGKEKMAISYIGNWYMPDYLPIGIINEQYRFGFHSIPYHIDAGGGIYSRDPNTMGSPATGGCIQLKPEEATELFTWAKVGTPVYIYE